MQRAFLRWEMLMLLLLIKLTNQIQQEGNNIDEPS